MIFMEGSLLTPPDRGSIIGSVAWKSRLIVLGSVSYSKNQNNFLSQIDKGSLSRTSLKSPSSNCQETSTLGIEDGAQLYLSIFKSKGELEYLAQYPMSAFQCCEVRNIQHRKQTPSLPTLILELKPDSTLAKLRKRRSSRAGSLGPKDPWSNYLLFRSPDDEPQRIYQWEARIKPLLTPVTDSAVATQNGPINHFTNQFVGKISSFIPSNKQELQARSWNPSRTSSPHHPSSQSSEIIISPTPSLRSRRSDLSSRASSQIQVPGFSTSTLHTASTLTDVTSACVREESDSEIAPNEVSTSLIIPRTPRETILDRAFQMRFIPGSEGLLSAEDVDKLSSTARFEALMREHERRKTEITINVGSTQDCCSMEEWGGELNASASAANLKDIVENSEDDMYLSDQASELSEPALRALNFIQGRDLSTNRALPPLPPPPKVPIRSRKSTRFPAPAFRSHSTDNGPGARPQGGAATRVSSGRSTSLSVLSHSSPPSSGIKDYGNSLINTKMGPNQRRLSSTSLKRLSFQEFTRRLSSTSSLLLAPTNASSSSRRASGDCVTDPTINSRAFLSRDERSAMFLEGKCRPLCCGRRSIVSN